MPKHDEGRRAFLVGTAVAGAAATTALVPGARAQTNSQNMPMQGDVMAPAMGGGHGAFFNDDDARTIKAFAERLMPGAPGKPGATDADVLNYIDLALSGSYTDQQEFYRHGLAQLDAHCLATYGKEFRNLSAAQQDETIAALEHGKTKAFSWPSAQAFFNIVHKHTMEGMFSDPVYGGNKNFSGWILVGFPGAQMQFTEQDMLSKEAFTREPIVGMQAALKSKRG
ncbi:MAG TPA: gluconate 2-dehydrogenase subunit 3 family protein [Xanthobacteraceae bacterium]|nr:gluconate 2-dehydrogenase subunit 3 family protein [Xanthobacteraceae bacterium]